MTVRHRMKECRDSHSETHSDRHRTERAHNARNSGLVLRRQPAEPSHLGTAPSERTVLDVSDTSSAASTSR